jgi:hypothetical protein
MNTTVVTKTGYTFADVLAMEPTDELYEILSPGDTLGCPLFPTIACDVADLLPST